MHVLSIVPRILDILAVVVGLNAWMDAVNNEFARFRPGSRVRCKLINNLSIFSWKKHGNASQSSLIVIEQNLGSFNCWMSNDCGMRNILVINVL